MDCEACTDRLVELLYEELPEEDAEATRAHLSGCEACSQAFAQIRAGKGLAAMLEMAEPPASVLDAVMAAARERVADRAPAQEPAHERPATAPRPDEEEASGPWAAFLKWVGGFAMRPQLAMALTLLLIVGLGMWYLPTLRQSDPADSHAIVDPAPGDEAGPSTSLVPAEPLDLEADPRTGRIRTREDEAAEERVAAVRPAPPAPTPEPAPEVTGERSVPPPSPPRRTRRDWPPATAPAVRARWWRRPCPILGSRSWTSARARPRRWRRNRRRAPRCARSRRRWPRRSRPRRS